MRDPEKTVEGLKQVYLHFERMTEISYDGDSARFEELKEWTGDALELLKEHDAVIDALLKVGYPHDFQNEEPWIVNYMWAITDVIRKAVRIRNAKGAKVDG